MLLLLKTLLFFLHCLAFQPTLSSRAEFQLYKDLLSNYNAMVRPVRNSSDQLIVAMSVSLQQIIRVDEKNQLIEINAWLKYVWKDYRLTWNSDKYEYLKSVRFPGDGTIWQPDVLMYNSAGETFDASYKSNLVVYSDGVVNWIPPGIFKASCKIDITWFPFDDQSCYLKFGSWTYHGDDLDLQIDQNFDSSESEPMLKPSMDLSGYIPSGEWVLKDAPAFRDVKHYSCCQEPYPTIRFFMNLRRRTLYHGFNLIIPSLIISIMTILAFSLPAYDISEKIGFQTTILLSVCYFLTIVSEMTPTTSEAIPLLGIFFSTLTMVVAVSTTFTITVLSLRYRQPDNYHMGKTFRQIFLIWLPWVLMMNRPGYKFSKGRVIRSTADVTLSNECLQCVGTGAVEAKAYSKSKSNSSLKKHDIISKLDSTGKLHIVPTEQLGLERKVGDGIFTSRRYVNSKLRIVAQHEKYVQKCIQLISNPKSQEYNEKTAAIVKYYSMVRNKLKIINSILAEKERKKKLQEDWEYAAMVLDRLCLYIFSIFLLACLIAIFVSPSYLNA